MHNELLINFRDALDVALNDLKAVIQIPPQSLENDPCITLSENREFILENISIEELEYMHESNTPISEFLYSKLVVMDMSVPIMVLGMKAQSLGMYDGFQKNTRILMESLLAFKDGRTDAISITVNEIWDYRKEESRELIQEFIRVAMSFNAHTHINTITGIVVVGWRDETNILLMGF